MSLAVEHITLDGSADHPAPETEQPPRKTLCRYALAGDAGHRVVEVAILEGEHLRVRSPGPPGGHLDYQFDLRFADPTPVRDRRLPWFWMLVASSLTASGLGTLLVNWPAAIDFLGAGVTLALVLTLVTVAAGFVCLRWTIESLLLVSAYGRATLVSVSGRLGSSRRHLQVFAVLSKHVLAARNAHPQEKPQFLRDEMREHYRLRQLGVLSEAVYETSKAAILAAH